MTIPEKVHNEFILLKAAFENGSITKMSQLEKQMPTRIAALIGMNQGRYGSKLFSPWEFSTSEIIRIALVINIEPGLITNIIKLELVQKETERILKNIEKEDKKKKQK
ncbi:hypothetical protein [Sphingobacterium faecale]|uniref:XRE family transcriptional regulator n=1 Tax=Sphingobacterium faecale TaxID=2803775 RepID=A0ABS1R989_9SPHI|nr:hypothetical protein [Sphingobacterium faecale]MBL1410799.1 hypothetical protein [Sphingobacterium faecale]